MVNFDLRLLKFSLTEVAHLLEQLWLLDNFLSEFEESEPAVFEPIRVEVLNGE